MFSVWWNFCNIIFRIPVLICSMEADRSYAVAVWFSCFFLKIFDRTKGAQKCQMLICGSKTSVKVTVIDFMLPACPFLSISRAWQRSNDCCCLKNIFMNRFYPLLLKSCILHEVIKIRVSSAHFATVAFHV